MAAKTFTDFALRLHDNDATTTWGGHVSSDTGTPVHDCRPRWRRSASST